MNAPNPAAAAQSLHDDIMDYIGKADAMITGGEFTSLAGLDVAVTTLCQRVEALDTQVAKQFAPQLEQLLAQLDALQKKMQGALDQCKADVDEFDKHRKAAKAYQGKKGKK